MPTIFEFLLLEFLRKVRQLVWSVTSSSQRSKDSNSGRGHFISIEYINKATGGNIILLQLKKLWLSIYESVWHNWTVYEK